MAKVIKTAIISAVVAVVTVVILGPAGLGVLNTAGASLTVGSLTLTGTAAVAATYAAIAFVGTAVAGGVGMLTSRGISATRGNFGTKIAGRGAQVPRQIVYGECRVGGTIVKMHTSGTKNNKLHLAIVLAGHEIESLDGVYLNDTLLTTTTTTVGGETVYRVTNAKYKNTDNEHEIDTNGTLIQYTFHDGSQTTVDGLASTNASSRYPGTAKFQGMAYVYMEIIYDPEKMPSLPPLSFRIKGKKVYDPRNSTTAYSNNPALIIRDYLVDTTYGLRALSSEINDTTAGGGFAAAANACDATVTLEDNSTTEARFTLNGFVNAASSGDGILEGFLTSCAGKLTYTNGKFNIFVGTAQTPTLTINDEDVLDTQQLSTKTGNGDLFNGIKALYVDKDQNYQGAESPLLVDSTYLAEDTPSGEQSANYKKILETQLPFTTTHQRAQRIQKIQLRRQRESATLTMLTTLEFMKLQPGDWVNVTNTRFSYNAKSFEVLSVAMEFGENDGVLYAATRLVLQEVSASIYDYTYSEYSDPQTAGSTPPGGDLSVGSPTAGTLSQRTRPEGPTAKIDIIASWTNAAETGVQGTEIQYKESGESAYDVATIAGRGATSAVIQNVQVGKTYDVRIRHFSWDNVYGSFVSFSQLTIAEPDTLSAPGNPSATTTKPFFIELTWTNPTNANFRAVEVHYSTTSGFTPDDNTLLNTYYGEPAKQKKVILGVSAGLLYDTNYYFKLRSVNVYGTTSAYTNQTTGQFKKAQNADVENLNASAITAGTIDASTITVENIDAGNISTGTLNSSRVNAGEIVVGGLESGVTIDSGSLTMSAGGHIKGGQTGYNDTSNSGFFLGYDTNAYKFSIGSSATKSLTFDGTDLTIGGSVNIGSTAASTVESGAAAGATASQVNKGLALLINQNVNGATNNGEAGLVGVDKDGEPETGTDGFILHKGNKITIERGQYSTYTILTHVANKRGFICFDANKTEPFDMGSAIGDVDVAFVWKEGDQWYYDNNSTVGVTFTPASITGAQNGTDGTTTPDLVAIGWLETGTTDLIVTGALFDPIALESAPFAGDTYNSGTIGGIEITGSYIQSSNFAAGSAGFKLQSNGDFEAGNGTFRGAITATSGSIANSVTIGSTAASTVESGAASGATALQISDISEIISEGNIPTGKLTFNTSGGATITFSGNDLTSSGGTDNSWESQAYSSEHYDSPLVLQFEVGTTGLRYMMGLNEDPTTNAAYGSIDYAWYQNVNTFTIYESGSQQAPDGGAFTYAVGDKMSIVYDGTNIYYYHNNTLKRTVSNVGTKDFYLDSSFYDSDTQTIKDIRLAPISRIDFGSIGGITIEPQRLYQGGGVHGSTNTGFYLDSDGKFSLKNKLSFDGADLTIDGDITARDLNISNATVTGTLSANNLAIDGVTLDTNASGEIIIADGGVSNTQLASGSVALSNLIEGSVSKVNPVTQTQNVYRWAGYDDAGNVVNAVPSGITVEYDTTEKALELRCDGNVGMRSDTFKIDQNSIYKISFKIKKDAAVGLWYIGAYQLTSATTGFVNDGGNVQSSQAFTVYNYSTRASGSDANAYFWNASATTSYVSFVCYLLGSNVNIDEVPSQTTTIIQAADGYDHVGLRFLNWNNAGTVTSLFIKDLSVVEMTATTIIADNISTTNLAAINSDLGAITAGSLDINSAFTVTSAGVMTATGANVAGTITATAGSIGGIDIGSSKIYVGDGDWQDADTGFYLDNTGKFSLKDKLFFNPTNNLLTVDGNITADIVTAKTGLEVLGTFTASGVAAGGITRAMLSQGALDEIFGSLATAVGGSNGDFKSGSGSFTTSGGSVELGTSSDKFDHGTASVSLEFNINTYFYATTDYSTASQRQATLTFEATADGTYTDLTSATKTQVIEFGRYDLSSYYGTTYLVYFLNSAFIKTFTTGTGNDLPDNTDLQFRVSVSSVGTAFTGQTIPFVFEANEGVTGVTSTGGNADTLDNLDSTAFLRSNVDDTFDGTLTITGDLILQGGIDQYNVTNLDVTDKTITVNNGGTQTLSDGSGLIVDRGTAADASITWDETNDKFVVSHPIQSDKFHISSDTEHSLSYLTTSNISGASVHVSELRGRQIDLYAYDDINLRSGAGSADDITFYSGGSKSLTLDGGQALTAEGISQFKRDVRVNGQIRATGWYNAAADTDYTGVGVEMGVSGTQPYIIAYDRDTSSYSDLYFNATDYLFESQPATGSGATARIAQFKSNSSTSAYIQVNATNQGANYAYLELMTASTVSGSPTDRGYLIKNRENGTGNSLAAGSLYLYNETGPIDLVPNSATSYRTTVGTNGQLVVRSENDAPIVATSTDAYTGVQFTDTGGSDYLFYIGSSNHFYTSSSTLSVNGSTLATGYEFQVNGDANITGRIEANGITTDDNAQTRLASTNAGYFNTIPHDQNTGYMNFGAGAFGLLYRNGYDSYVLNNAYYYRTNNSSSWYGKFTGYNAGSIDMYDGRFLFRNTNGTDVTSGQAFAFTTQMEISQTGNVTIQGDLTSNGDVTGDSFHTENGWIDSNVKNSIQVIGDNKSPFMFRNNSNNNVFSALPWSGGHIYLTFGGYYDGSNWIERSTASTPYLSLLTAGHDGFSYYHTTAFNSDREQTSWNDASDVSLWNQYGEWVGDINTAEDITVNGMVSNARVSATEFDLPSGGMIDWANGDARIIEGQTENYSLSFQTYNGSSVTTALRLDGDNTAHFFGPAHIIGNASYVGNYGYNTLILEDTSGYPGINFREGSINWLQRKSGADDDLEFVFSSDASAQGTGSYYPRFTIHYNGGIDTHGGDVDAGSGIFNSDSGVSVFAGAKVNAGGMYVHGGGTYTDTGSQMFMHTDASGYGRIAVYDLRFLVGANNSRTIQALRLESDGDAVFGNTVNIGHASLSHQTDYSWRGLTIQNNGDSNECTVDGKSSDGTQQFVVYGGGQSQGFLHPTAYSWRFKVPLTGSLQRDNAYDIYDEGNYPQTLSITGHASGSATLAGSTGTKALSVTVSQADKTANLGQYVWDASDNPSETSGTSGYAWTEGITTSFVRSNDGYPSYGSVIRVKTYPNDGGAGELYFPYNATYGGNHLRFRLGLYNNAGMTAFRDVIDSSNYHQVKQGDFSADAFKWQGNSEYYFDPNPAVTTALRFADTNIDMRGVLNSQTDNGQIILSAYNGPSTGNGTAQGPAIVWKPNYSGYTKESLKIAGIAKDNYFDMDMVFYTNGSSDTSSSINERFRLTQEGTAYFTAPHVGINTTTLGNTAWGSTGNTGQLTIYGSNYGVLNLKGDYGTNAHFSMGVGDDRFYMAYKQSDNHFVTVHGTTVGLGEGNVTLSQSHAVDIAGNVLLDGVLDVHSTSAAATMLELGDSTQNTYTNVKWFSDSGTMELFKNGTASTSWGGASSANIYSSNSAIHFHPNGIASQFIVGQSYVQFDKGLRAKSSAGGNYGPMFSANNVRAQASVGHNTSYGEGIWWHSSTSYYIADAVSGGGANWSSTTGYRQLELDWPTGVRISTATDGTYLKSYLNIDSAIYADEAIHAPIYYDETGTTYYLDLASTGTSLRVAGNIVAYYSDERLKDIECAIPNALESVNSLTGFYYTPNGIAQNLGYKKKREVGVSAQDVQKIMPEVVTESAVDPEYLTVDYAKLVPLLIEAIKDLSAEVKALKAKIEDDE